MATLDDARRETLLRRTTELVMRDGGIIPLPFQAAIWAMSADLRYEPNGLGRAVPRRSPSERLEPPFRAASRASSNPRPRVRSVSRILNVRARRFLASAHACMASAWVRCALRDQR
jgi:hypothetical protein